MTLEMLASEFVRYWTTDRTPDGCGMCGGIPHSTTCYVGRMASLLDRPARGERADYLRGQICRIWSMTGDRQHEIWTVCAKALDQDDRAIQAQTSAPEPNTESKTTQEGVTLPVGEKPAFKCHGGAPHYCPNCDRSFSEGR